MRRLRRPQRSRGFARDGRDRAPAPVQFHRGRRSRLLSFAPMVSIERPVRFLVLAVHLQPSGATRRRGPAAIVWAAGKCHAVTPAKQDYRSSRGALLPRTTEGGSHEGHSLGHRSRCVRIHRARPTHSSVRARVSCMMWSTGLERIRSAALQAKKHTCTRSRSSTDPCCAVRARLAASA